MLSAASQQFTSGIVLPLTGSQYCDERCITQRCILSKGSVEVHLCDGNSFYPTEWNSDFMFLWSQTVKLCLLSGSGIWDLVTYGKHGTWITMRRGRWKRWDWDPPAALSLTVRIGCLLLDFRSECQGRELCALAVQNYNFKLCVVFLHRLCSSSLWPLLMLLHLFANSLLSPFVAQLTHGSYSVREYFIWEVFPHIKSWVYICFSGVKSKSIL